MEAEDAEGHCCESSLNIVWGVCRDTVVTRAISFNNHHFSVQNHVAVVYSFKAVSQLAHCAVY